MLLYFSFKVNVSYKSSKKETVLDSVIQFCCQTHWGLGFFFNPPHLYPQCTPPCPSWTAFSSTEDLLGRWSDALYTRTHRCTHTLQPTSLLDTPFISWLSLRKLVVCSVWSLVPVGLRWLIQDTQVRMYRRHPCSSWWLGGKRKGRPSNFPQGMHLLT